MRVDEFLVERWMNEYEHDVEVNLAETCQEPFTLRGYLEFVGREDFLERNLASLDEDYLYRDDLEVPNPNLVAGE